MKLSILYRGPLSSCNYDCSYCPFAKQRDPRELLERDQQQLVRFVDWIRGRIGDEFGILFTPWGEALVRRWYQEAIVRLSHMPHVRRVAIQTNIACRLDWLERCRREAVALWCTYHPSQIALSRFLSQCRELDSIGVAYSVGVVGLREHYDAIDQLRRRLRPEVYLWINAYKRQTEYYSAADVDRLAAIDPLFEINNRRHASLGRACHAGESVIAVDGEGNVRRCHFIPEVMGNLYNDDLHDLLKPRVCTQQTCGCHIGYVHMPDLDLYSLFGPGVLERIPARPMTRQDARSRLHAGSHTPFTQLRLPPAQVSTVGR